MSYNVYTGLSEEVLFLILLVWWLPVSQHDGTQVIEFFAGVGRISEMAALMGYKSKSYDIDYTAEWAKKKHKRSPMDLNSNAGFTFLGQILEKWCF